MVGSNKQGECVCVSVTISCFDALISVDMKKNSTGRNTSVDRAARSTGVGWLVFFAIFEEQCQCLKQKSGVLKLLCPH